MNVGGWVGSFDLDNSGAVEAETTIREVNNCPCEQAAGRPSQSRLGVIDW